MFRQSLGSLLALLFGIGVSILLPRVLGAEGRGEYQLTVKAAGLVLAIAQWGIPEVLLQFLAEERAAAGSDPSAESGALRTALVPTSLLLGLLVAFANERVAHARQVYAAVGDL